GVAGVVAGGPRQVHRLRGDSGVDSPGPIGRRIDAQVRRAAGAGRVLCTGADPAAARPRGAVKYVEGGLPRQIGLVGVPLRVVPELGDVLSFDVGHDEDGPGDVGVAGDAGGRQVAEGVVVVVAGDGELVQVVAATDTGRGLADLLDRRKQQADQDG